MKYEKHQAVFAAEISCAFTLAELLMAVLVISIIMVALAPVITKRVHENMNVELAKVKGEEIFSNPGDYTFEVPAGITTLYIQGAAGSGGGGGASITQDWEYTFTSEDNISPAGWIVPKGVNEIELALAGGGGGGGAGYVKDNDAVYMSPSMDKLGTPLMPGSSYHARVPDVTLYSNKCLSDEFLAIRASEQGYDLCITKKNVNMGDWISKIMSSGDIKAITKTSPESDARYCYQTGFCYWPKGVDVITGMPDDPVYPALNRPLISPKIAQGLCAAYHSNEKNGYYSIDANYNSASYDLLSNYTAQKIIDNASNWGGTNLKLCGHFAGTDLVACTGHATCPGVSSGNSCSPNLVVIKGGILDMNSFSSTGDYVINNTSLDFIREAVSLRCARPLIRSVNHNGAGGSSGYVMQRKIQVLPGDRIEVGMGSGGSGGVMGTNNGKGSDGGSTYVWHYRGSVLMGQFEAEGGLGGGGATASQHGKYSSIDTYGRCKGKYRPNNDPTKDFANHNYCSEYAKNGVSGTDASGGMGAVSYGERKVQAPGGLYYEDPDRNASSISSKKENACSNGESAMPYSPNTNNPACPNRDNMYANKSGYSQYSGGGGGGYAPVWLASYSAANRKNYAKGGNGGSGAVVFKFKVIVPGAGGGAGTRVAGFSADKDADNNFINHEILYKVKEGDKLKITVGSGGLGGGAGQNGGNGSVSTISTVSGSSLTKTITLLAGQGGQTGAEGTVYAAFGYSGTFSGDRSAAYMIDMVEFYPKHKPGSAGVIDAEGKVVTNTLGLILPSTSDFKHSATPPASFRGSDGKREPQGNLSYTPSQNDALYPWLYRLDGGTGGVAFYGSDNFKNEMQQGLTCGGGVVNMLRKGTGSAAIKFLNTYACLTGNADGASGKKTSGDNVIPTSGGGGGAAALQSITPGKGGDGSPGYIKIRWNQADNIEW